MTTQPKIILFSNLPGTLAGLFCVTRLSKTGATGGTVFGDSELLICKTKKYGKKKWNV